MSRLTINPADVIDYKTPLYKEDREVKKVYRLLPETTADQVKYAGGQNGEAVKTALEASIAGAQSAAEAAQSTANSASASAAQAGQTANSALSTANTAKSTADGVKAQVDNTTTGLAATKAIADNALAAANEAKGAAIVMQGATADAAGEKGLVPKPVAGNQNKYLRGDGTWQTPPDTNTTYSNMTGATTSVAGTSGLVPAPTAGSPDRFLSANGTWKFPYTRATSSEIEVYISKNGNDNNLGLTPDTPVLTPNRAVEVASAIHRIATDAYVVFRFGAGNWGNVLFTRLPYIFHIQTYDGTVRYEYSSDLPQFGLLKITSCSAILVNIIADLVVFTRSHGYISSGYKRINSLDAADGSWVSFSINSALPGDQYHVGQCSVANRWVFLAATGSNMQFPANYKITLDENVTAGNFFLVNDGSSLTLPRSTTYNFNNHTFTGQKLYLNTGCSIITYDITKFATVENIPGSGKSIAPQSFYDGVSLSSLPKGGGTMTGELFWGNNIIYPITSLVDANVNEPPATNKTYTLGQVYSTVSNRALSQVRSWQKTDGNIASDLIAFNLKASGEIVEGIIGVFAYKDGTTYGFAPTPLGAAAEGQIATANWTRARISAATGKAASAFSLGSPEVAVMSIDGLEACAWNAGIINPDMIKAAYSAIKDNITQRIFEGFYYEIGGEEYFFTYDLYDQQNLADAALLANSGVDEVSLFARNENWELQEIVTPFNEAIAVWKYGVMRKKSLMSERLTMKKAVEECSSYPELELLLEDMGLLESYLDYYAALEISYEASNFGLQNAPEFDSSLLPSQDEINSDMVEGSEYGPQEVVS